MWLRFYLFARDKNYILQSCTDQAMETPTCFEKNLKVCTFDNKGNARLSNGSILWKKECQFSHPTDDVWLKPDIY